MSRGTKDDPVTQLRQSLAQNAFALYCQPIGALGGAVVDYPMAEVLIRLREEEHALLPPGDFLPVLEQCGLMPLLDRWVVRRVLRFLASGSHIGRFAINLSAQTLADGAFPKFVAEALSASRVAGKRLLFEIEEADAVAAPQSTARFAALAGALGVGVAIDGFGRTPGSFFLLDTPRVEFLKLHGSLTRRLLVDTKPVPELERVLREAAMHGIALIAESVEEPQALRLLKRLGVAYAQGFGVFKPRPLEDFAEPQALQVA